VCRDYRRRNVAFGHQVDTRVVHTSKACSGEHPITKLSRSGSIMSDEIASLEPASSW